MSSGWTCGRCGRHVPGAIGECRCGAVRPITRTVEAIEEADQPTDQPDVWARVRSIGSAVIVLGLAGTGAYLWYASRQQPTAQPEAERARTTAAPAPLPDRMPLSAPR